MGVEAWLFVFLGGLLATFAVLVLVLDYVEQNSRVDAVILGATFAFLAGLGLVFGYQLGDGAPERHPDTGAYQAVTDCEADTNKHAFKCLVRQDGVDDEMFVVVNVYNVDAIARGNWLRLEKQDNGWYNVFRVDPKYLEPYKDKTCPVQK